MSAEPILDPARGRLEIAEPTLAVLVAHAADPVAAALHGPAAELAALSAAGVIDGGRSHPAIADAVAAIVSPDLCTLELAAPERAVQGWCSTAGAALLLPAAAGDERRSLVQVHPTLLPGALARLVDLGPRPRARVTAPLAAAELDDAERRWRLSASWTSGDGISGGGALEVVDAGSGLWLLHSGSGADRLAWPVTPTFVWRHIIRLLMRRPPAERAVDDSAVL